MQTETPSPYRPKITEKTLDAAPVNVEMPAKVQQQTWQVESQRNGPNLWLFTLVSGVGCFLVFSIFQAVQGVLSSFNDYPFSSSVLGVALLAFVFSLCALAVREVRGYLKVNEFVGHTASLDNLKQVADKSQMRSALKQHASRFAPRSYAKHCYFQYEAAVNNDMTAQELLGLYQQRVIIAVERKANEVLKKESMTAGGVSFISPNHLIQTLSIVWVSLRTIRRIALVFGLRPATIGNWKLFKVLAENVAAQSLFDIATDEITSQISGSISAKLVENSAEAVAAGALNVRLGKALIRMLK